MEGDEFTGALGKYLNGFNPRPRMEGDGGLAYAYTKSIVSIHALAWRATVRNVCVRRKQIVSIHAPRMEGDRYGVRSFRHGPGFNPRPRMEGDAGPHTGRDTRRGFNPRPRMEGDVFFAICFFSL